MRFRGLIPIFCCAISLLAQETVVGRGTEGIQKSLHIRKIESSGIRIDGELNEPLWKTIEPVMDLVQTQPDLGQVVSERTEVRIFYDEKNLYFGFTCFDSSPEKIVARLGAHDGFTGSDSVNILLDTFGDRRSGYFYSINSRGIQFDALANEGRGNGFESYDSTWDGIWYSAAKLHDWGYSVEVAIPFQSIRVPNSQQQVWGLNFSRDIVRKNESAYWVPVTRFDAVMKPSKAGVLTGIEGVKPGRNTEVIPYVSTAYRRSSWAPDLEGFKANGGVDMRHSLTANMTLTATVNPDFADTEADEFTSQISRFEIFYPEKRKFFTEGANYFQTPMNLFFSRRIGAVLPDGEPQRILEGGKITGQSGPWTIGALEALTQEQEFVDPNDDVRKTAPAALFAVARIQRRIFEKSAVGLLSVNRFQNPGSVGQQQNTQAVDLQILHGQHTQWNSQAMVNLSSSNPGVDWQHTGFQSEFEYNSEKFAFETGGKFLGRHTDLSFTGYDPEVDRRLGWIETTWKPFINRGGVRQIFATVSYDQSNGTRGELQDSSADLSFQVQFKNFWNLLLAHNYDRVRFNELAPDFKPVCGPEIPPCPTRVYTAPVYRIELSTNENRPVALAFKFQTGKTVQFDEYFYGSQKTYDLHANIRLGGNARWEVSAIRVSESLQNGIHYQNRDYLISRLNYQFTPKLRARVLTQYFDDIHGHNLSVNSLFAYDFTARSALFVGYNRQKHTPLFPSDLGDQFYIKMSYLLGF